MSSEKFVVETILKKYNGNESVVTIPQDVTEIGESAFNDLTYDKHQNLTCVNFPKNLHHIGKYAFANCTALSEVMFPESLISIGTNAFANCKKITRINIPKNVKYIADTAFSGCPKLAFVTVDENNSVFHAVDNCLIETTTSTLILGGIISNVPTGVLAIGKSAFSGRDIEILTIPEGVCSIGAYAFNGCREKLTDVFIPASVTKIGGGAFLWCGSKKGVPFTIHAPAYSYAEQYAKENDIPFVAE